MRAALIDKQSGKIENVLELPDDYDHELEGAYLPPEGYRIVKDPEGKAITGGVYDQGVWTTPEPEPESEPDPASVEGRLKALETEIRSMKERASAAVVTPNTDAGKIRDAITGPPN